MRFREDLASASVEVKTARKILLLGWMIGSGSSGVYIYELAGYLARKGYSVTCLSAGKCDWNVRPRLVVTQEKPFRMVELRNPPVLVWGRPADPEADIDSPETLRLLRQVLGQFKPRLAAVIDFPGWPADTVRICQEAGSRVSVTLHNFWPFCSRLSLLDRWGNVCKDYEDGRRCISCMENVLGGAAARWRARLPGFLQRYAALHGLLKRLYRAGAGGRASLGAAPRGSYAARRQAYARAIRQADMLCCISARTAALARSFGAVNSKTVLTPVILSHLKTLHEACASARARQSPLRFGFLGGLSPMKGPEVLVEAFRGIPPSVAVLHFHGGGAPDYLRSLKQLADPANLPIFHGAYRQPDLPAILADLDVGIVPSICEDTRPNTVMEFQAAGVPVLGSRIGGIPEMIDEERNGLLFEPGDAGALRSALDVVIGTPRLVDRWRSNLPFLEPETAWQQMETLFDELIAELPSPAANGHPPSV